MTAVTAGDILLNRWLLAPRIGLLPAAITACLVGPIIGYFTGCAAAARADFRRTHQ